jgi:prepilin-type processing-associated H-X9-DG protein
MSCTNNLKQLGLACHNRHDTQGYFPSCSRNYELSVVLVEKHKTAWTAAGQAHGERNMIGYAPMLLPYIEQSALWDAFWNMMDSDCCPAAALSPKVFYYSYQTGSPSKLWETSIPAFLCPSSSYAVSNPASETGRISYHCCRGDVFCRYDTGSGRGIFDPAGPVSSSISRRVNIASIEDGTSNTILVSETINSPPNGSKKYTQGVAEQIGDLDSSIKISNPSVCLMSTIGSEYNTPTVTVSNRVQGRAWGGPEQYVSQFFTILPPNSPSCFGTHEGWLLQSASSNHSGGVNAAFADGAVKFIPNTIDAKNFDISGETSISNYCLKTTGASRHGVWGALGSANGGESVTF